MSGFYRRHNGQDGEHGVDDWLMTYADMITLLLCFFAIFLSMSVPKKEKFEKAREEVMQKFADPVKLPSLLEGKFPSAQTPPEEEIRLEALPSILTDTSGKPQNQTDQQQANPDQPPPKPGDVAVDTRDRITVIEMNSAPFFASGSARLNPDGEKLLHGVLEGLGKDNYKDYRITIEGHTDDVPISTPQFPSNWELSTARAATVARFLIENGVPPQRLRASGYADVFPKVPNRDAAGKPIPDNQAKNRRVVIRLEKISKADPAPTPESEP